jgi:hypothetical protein
MRTISNSLLKRIRRGRAGSALLIVLAFVVLLAALVLAFFSRSLVEQQVSIGSANQVKVDNFTTGAVATILSDLKQEIEDGSSAPTFPIAGNNYIYYYAPTSSAANNYPTMLPAVTGSASGLPPGTTFGSNSLGSGALVNLVKVSLHLQKFYATSVPPYNAAITNPLRAAAISTGSSSDSTGTIASGSTDGTSLNGRYVSGTRWNKPLFLAPGTLFPLPDWIYVERTPSTVAQNPTAWATNLKASPTDMTTSTTVLGRYAYAIYDEGGLLDVNVAGAPTPLASAGTLNSLGAYKTGEALADLTQIPGLTQTLADKIVGWRNNASAAQYQGTATSSPLTGNVNSGYTWSGTNGTNYFFNVLLNPTGFMRPVSTGTSTGTLSQTDQFFTSRQQLLQFFNTALGGGTTVNGALQYLTHFSRSLEQPSYVSPVSITGSTAPLVQAYKTSPYGGNSATGGDATINPSFLASRVATAFPRNDGSIANVGDPLVKKRFALARLAWLTSQGPSASRNGVATGTTASSTAGNSDYDIYLMENTYGIPQSFLALGTAANIYKYFGLSWVSDPNNSGSSEWVYSHTAAAPISTNSPSSSSIATLPNPIGTGLNIVSGRDPDFFELLKAGITVGSIAKPYTVDAAYYVSSGTNTPADYYGKRDKDVDNTIVQIGANIISQYQPSGYPARILFNDGLFGVTQEHRGVVDLPYMYEVQDSKLRTQDSSPAYTSCPALGAPVSTGTAVNLQVPVIWNPHAWTSTSDNSDGNPRPTNFRIYAETCSPWYDATGLHPDPTMNFYVYWDWRGGNGLVYPSTDAVPAAPAASLTQPTTEMDFTIPQSTTAASDYNYLFREPTILNKPGIPTGSGLAVGAGTGTGTNTIKSVFGNYIPSVDASSYYTNVGASDNKQYIGVVLGGTGAVSGTTTLPLAWKESLPKGAIDGTLPSSTGTYTVPAEFTGVSNSKAYITYRLQYQDGNSNWITYDEKYAPIICGNQYNTWKNGSGGWGYKFSTEALSDELAAVCFDPRTGRWGVNYAGHNGRGLSCGGWPLGTGPSTAQPGWAAPVGSSQLNSAGQNAIWTARPDEYQGFGLATVDAYGVAFSIDTGPAAGGWYPAPANATTSQGYTCAIIRPGLTCQNNLAVSSASASDLNRYAGDSASQPAGVLFGAGCYADPDGVVRRGMAAYVPPTSSIPASTTASGAGAASGIPLKPAYTFSNTGSLTPNSELASRPIMLNRPFRSVADIGYVFSDTPWRNLDFSTPESGNSALLDIFCINDTDDPNGLVAGKVNLNTRQPTVIRAILTGAYKDEFSPTSPIIAATGSATTATADNIAAGLISKTTSTAMGAGPLVNVSELVGKWSPPSASPKGATNVSATAPFNIDGSQSYIGFSGTSATTATPSASPANLSSILYGDATANGSTAWTTNNVNRYREATMRALSSCGQTRVWNLMIDVIAQTGRFPSTAGTLNNFMVEGEQRYWVHIAIDRMTGQVIDQQVEVVKE